MTSEQRTKLNQMLSAPAGGWVHTKTLKAKLLGIECSGVALQIESPKLRIWGVILPDGTFLKPKPGRKTIDASEIAFKL